MTFCNFDQKPSYFTDNTGLKYTVYKSNEIRGFYSKNGVLIWLEFEGKRYDVPKMSAKLNTQIFENLEEVR